MKTSIVVLALLSSVYGLVGRTNSWYLSKPSLILATKFTADRQKSCFGLTATGATDGKVGQLSDGQNRIGESLSPTTYCIDDGAIVDEYGRGCILTPPTTQFQCDEGAVPSSGFSIDCHGIVEQDASSKFYACPTGESGGYNIYTIPPHGQAGCSAIILSTDKCHAACPMPSPTPAPPLKCSTELSGDYELPHLIKHVDLTQPTTSFPTSYNGTVSPRVSSIFNFDIPVTNAGKTCSLIFLFPDQSQLQTSAYTFSGTGDIDFVMLSSPANAGTTFATVPAVETSYGITAVAPGNSYNVATFPCPPGKSIGFELKSRHETCLDYFQDYNPSPIGLYITAC